MPPTVEPTDIRPASAGDIPTVERVLGRSHAEVYRRRLDRPGALLAAWRSDQLVGAIFVSWSAADERKIRWLLPGVPLLHHLHIAEEHRRNGVGTMLVRATEALASDKGYRRLAVGVDLDNPQALSLYRSLGFRRWFWGTVNTERDMYDDYGELMGTEPDRCQVFVRSLQK